MISFPRSLFKVLLYSSLLVFSSSLLAQTANPLESDPRAARAGGVIFRAQCATCHGADAKGISTIDAPDLTLTWADGDISDGDVFQIIQNGIEGSIMPPHGFPDTEIWMLVSFLRSVAVSGASQSIAGDAEQGSQLFADNCARCHRAAGNGGSLGPDLSSIVSRRSLQALLNSVRNPSEIIGRGYKPVALLTGDGERVRGTLKSEDAFSMQLMDINQQLRAFMKSELQEIDRPSDSLMPAFSQAALSESELNDILSYLQLSAGR